MTLILLLASILTACGASGGGTADVPAGLLGIWRWQETSGGIAGTIERPDEEQPVRTIEFRRDGTAVFRLDDATTASRGFQVRDVLSIFDGKPRPALFYDEGSVGEVIRLSDDGQTLTLSQNVHDGFSASYRRVKESAKEGQ